MFGRSLLASLSLFPDRFYHKIQQEAIVESSIATKENHGYLSIEFIEKPVMKNGRGRGRARNSESKKSKKPVFISSDISASTDS